MEEETYWQERLSREQHQLDLRHQSKMNVLVETEEMNLFALLKPKVGIDGNQYYVLYGEDLQSGIAGFGDTQMLAIYDWNKSFHRPINKKQHSQPLTP